MAGLSIVAEEQSGATVAPAPALAPAPASASGALRRHAMESGTQVLVVAFPFTSFGRANAFIEAVRALPGVIAATPRRMHGGALYLAVEGSTVPALAGALAGLTAFRARVTPDGNDTISVVIEPA